MAKFKGVREAFAAALTDLVVEGKDVYGVFPDSLSAMRAVAFGEKYPERYVECGIAEQCAVDVAAGMATTGAIPFVGSYAGFLTMRGGEQMRTFVGYTEQNVKFAGFNAGCMGGEREGVTHQFYEDLAFVSSLPNFKIFTPADGNQMYKAVKIAAEIQGPVYLRGGSGKEPTVYAEDAPFSPDGITVWKDYGTDAVIFSCGHVLDRVNAAADMLKEKGINVTTADINILYGDNPAKILDVMAKTDLVVTVEDHNINGGLGSYISRLATENRPVKVKRIALEHYSESGPAKELGDKEGFSPENICAVVAKCLGK